MPGYIVVQLAGATLAALFLQAVIDVSATYGSNYPAAGYSAVSAFWMEFILTLGLVSVILGTASGAQNIGIVGAFGVGGYIALAGLWGSPISGTSMNPARTFGPDLVGGDFSDYWVYVAGPIAGAAVAVVFGVRAARPGRRPGRVRRRARSYRHRDRRSEQGVRVMSSVELARLQDPHLRAAGPGWLLRASSARDAPQRRGTLIPPT